VSRANWGTRYLHRAVFHFLTEADEREHYLSSLQRCLGPGGFAVVATFGPDGPLTCSGLPIVRYTHDELAAQFPGFELISTSGRTMSPLGEHPTVHRHPAATALLTGVGCADPSARADGQESTVGDADDQGAVLSQRSSPLRSIE